MLLLNLSNLFMKQSYGELILKKDMTLYCMNYNNYNKIINEQNKNNLLSNIFFHPCQYKFAKYLFRIILKKDVSLFCNFELDNHYINNVIKI